MSLLLQGAGGPGANFDPLSLTPTVWYKPESLALADGAAVLSWPDSSGNSHPAAGTATYKTGVQNGRDVVRFNGTTDALSAVFSQSAPCTGFVVCRWLASPAGSPSSCDGGAANRMRLTQSSAGTTVTASVGGSSAGARASVGAAWHAYSMYAAVAAGSSEFRMDNDAPTTGGSTSVIQGVMLGSSSASFAQCDIAEYIRFPSQLSAGDHAAVFAYLKARWGTP